MCILLLLLIHCYHFNNHCAQSYMFWFAGKQDEASAKFTGEIRADIDHTGHLTTEEAES